jgi:hypothetical protein
MLWRLLRLPSRQRRLDGGAVEVELRNTQFREAHVTAGLHHRGGRAIAKQTLERRPFEEGMRTAHF